MKQYKITLKHDTGRYTIVVPAKTISDAISLIMKIENCPECSIISITSIKGKAV